MAEVNLYVWKPVGLGPDSFFVLAETLDQAHAAVARPYAKECKTPFACVAAWPEEYELSVHGVGEVVTNPNV